VSTALPQKKTEAGLLPKNLSGGISAACANARKNLLVLADGKISREVNFFVRSFAARITANAAFGIYGTVRSNEQIW
jgi:hypothetical protein